MPYKIYDFVEFKFSKSYLKSLPKHQLMFLSASSVVGNDMSVFAKLLAGYSYKPSDDKILREIASLHHWALRRQMSAKVIEFVKLFDRYIVCLSRTKDPDEIAYSNILQSAISLIKKSDEYRMAKDLRNQATNHYLLNNCQDAVDNYPNSHQFRMLIGSQSGNSFYPMGEEIAHLTHFDPDPSKGADLIKAVDWFHNAAGDLIEMKTRTLARIFKRHNPDPARKITLYVDDDLVSTEGKLLPLLFFNGPRSRI